MDFLFIFISIAGVVFAAVMLLLGFRTIRMERAAQMTKARDDGSSIIFILTSVS